MILTKTQANKFQELRNQILDLFEEIENNKPHDVNTIESVTDYACKLFKVKAKDLKSPSRKAEFKNARAFIFYFCKIELNMTYNEIGDYFNRDHASIIYWVRKFENDLSHFQELNLNYENFRFELL